MWAILRVALLAAALVHAACQYCVDGPGPHAVSSQPLGARCKASTECAAGLACIEDYCTVSCAGAPTTCPAGSNCIFDRLCLPMCSTDADCLLGSSVARCLGPSPPNAAYCFNDVCKSDAECPPRGRCVGVSKARGITWNEFCSHGFCQR
jgi:hypothetical protein